MNFSAHTAPPGPTTATASAQINASNKGYIREIILNDDGSGYSSTPNVAISTAPFAAGNVNATAVAITTQRAGIFSIERILLTKVEPDLG